MISILESKLSAGISIARVSISRTIRESIMSFVLAPTFDLPVQLIGIAGLVVSVFIVMKEYP